MNMQIANDNDVARVTSEIEGESDPRNPGRVAWRITARTEHEVMAHVQRIQLSEGVVHSKFTHPRMVPFYDDARCGWWRALGETWDQLEPETFTEG